MAFRPISITILICLLLLLGLFELSRLFYRPLEHHLNDDLQVVGVVDLDNTHNVTQKSILEGEDLILVADHTTLVYQKLLQKIPQLKYLTVEDLFSAHNLHLLDTDNDGLITVNDPIFEHLFLIRFDKQNKDVIKPLTQAGIKGIILDSAAEASDHQILMMDGTKRTLSSLIKFEKKQIPESKEP